MTNASNLIEVGDPLTMLTTSKVFRHLAATTLQEIAATGAVERYKVRTLLVKHGTIPTQFRFIAKGGMQVSLATLDGREARLPPDRPGEWGPWPGCFLDSPLRHDIWCLPSSVFLAFSMSRVQSAIADCPLAMREALQLMSVLARNLIAWDLSANLRSGEQRLAQLLVHLSGPGLSDAEGESEAQVSQEEIGQLGFGSRQLVARLLRQLEAQGFVEMNYRTVKICSRSKLRKFAFSEI